MLSIGLGVRDGNGCCSLLFQAASSHQSFSLSVETLLHLVFDKLVKHQLKKLYKSQATVHIHERVSPTISTSPLEAYGVETLHVVNML